MNLKKLSTALLIKNPLYIFNELKPLCSVLVNMFTSVRISVPDPLDFFYMSGSSDPYPDLADPGQGRTHLLTIVYQNIFETTTLLIKVLTELSKYLGINIRIRTRLKIFIVLT